MFYAFQRESVKVDLRVYTTNTRYTYVFETKVERILKLYQEDIILTPLKNWLGQLQSRDKPKN